jgi:hypothetical protein
MKRTIAALLIFGLTPASHAVRVLRRESNDRLITATNKLFGK